MSSIDKEAKVEELAKSQIVYPVGTNPANPNFNQMMMPSNSSKRSNKL